ncbi:MAG: hypothetical protein WCP93_03065 [Candidatus Berkelbacteria bacterium]
MTSIESEIKVVEDIAEAKNSMPYPLFDKGEKVDPEVLVETWSFQKVDQGSMAENRVRWIDSEGNVIITNEDNSIYEYDRNSFEKGDRLPVSDSEEFCGQEILNKWGLTLVGRDSNHGYLEYQTKDGLSSIVIRPNDGEVINVISKKGY